MLSVLIWASLWLRNVEGQEVSDTAATQRMYVGAVEYNTTSETQQSHTDQQKGFGV